MPGKLRLVPLLLVLGLVLAACGDGGDPSEELADAFQNTFDGSFAYEFTVDADADALAELGEGAGQAAGFLSGFSAAGTVDEDAASFAVTLLNQQIFQLRTIGQEAFYIQLGLNDFLAAFGGGGFDPQDELVPALDALGLGEEVKGAVIEAFNGSWVGVEGELDTEELSALLGGETEPVDEEAQQRFREVFGEDVPGFFERFVVVEEEESEDDVTSYSVLLQVHELFRAVADVNAELGVDDAAGLGDLEADLADLPETVPGTVITADDHVELITFDLAAAMADPDADGEAEAVGSVELRFEITDHDDVEPVEAPEDATVLTAEQFADALAKLAELTTGGFTGAPSD